MDADALRALADPQRLGALAKTQLTDVRAEPRFDRFTRLASRLLDAPLAAFSLLDAQRQLLKSVAGGTEPWASVHELPLSSSLCRFVVASGRPLQAGDLASEPAFCSALGATAPEMQSYLGVPVPFAGQFVGTLCAMDVAARGWKPEDIQALQSIADAIGSELELDLSRRAGAEQRALLRAVSDSAFDAIIMFDGEGKITFANRGAESLYALSEAKLTSMHVGALVSEELRYDFLARVRLTEEALPHTFESEGLRADGSHFPLELSLARHASPNGPLMIAVMRDVTNRDLALRSLRLAEEQFRLTLDHAAIGMAIVSIDGRWLRVNAALAKIVGYSREELITMTTLPRLAHPDDLDADRDDLERLCRGAIQSYERDKRYLHRDGRAIWIHLSVSLVRSNRGVPQFLIAQMQDMTARQQAEAQARLFFEQSRDMLAIVGTDGTLEQVNPSWERTLGWSTAELTHTPFLKFVHPDDAPRTGLEAEQAYRGEAQANFRNRYRAKDGIYHWLEWTSRRTEDGRLFCIARDVSAQVARDEWERAQAQIIHTVLESMQDAVIVADAVGQVVHCNEAARRTLSEIPLRGQSSQGAGLFLPDKTTPCPAEQVPMVRALRGESVEQRELWVRSVSHPEGAWWSITGNSVRDQNGKIIGGVVVGRDISTAKELEETLRQVSLRDELTGLHNRRGFMLVAESMVRAAARHRCPLTLLFVDLDGMKTINDQLGHGFGDKALVETAGLLARTCRGSDLIARMGGDEFVVLTESEENDGATLAQRIQGAVEMRNSASDHAYALSLSIGLATYRAERPSSIADLLARADQAMYDEKRRLKSLRPLDGTP